MLQNNPVYQSPTLEQKAKGKEEKGRNCNTLGNRTKEKDGGKVRAGLKVS